MFFYIFKAHHEISVHYFILRTISISRNNKNLRNIFFKISHMGETVLYQQSLRMKFKIHITLKVFLNNLFNLLSI